MKVASVGLTRADLVLGDGTQTSNNHHISFRVKLNCSSYQQDITSCIEDKYLTKTNWKLVVFNKQQLQDKIQYTYKSDLGNGEYDTSNSYIPRRIEDIPSRCRVKIEEKTEALERGETCEGDQFEICANLCGDENKVIECVVGLFYDLEGCSRNNLKQWKEIPQVTCCCSS